MNKRRIRPYEKKRVSKAGAIIFGIGLVALAVTILVISSIIIPDINTRLDNLAYRAKSYYRSLLPHPEYLPAPQIDTANIPIVSTDNLPNLNPSVHSTAALSEVANTSVEEQVGLEAEVSQTQTDNNILLSSNFETTEITPVQDEFIQLTGFNHQWQTWNNCGPATITTYMSYFGHTEDQADAAQFLKPNRDDKNVTPQELAAYARSLGMETTLRQGGSIDRIKEFLNNDIPILVETWLTHDGDGLGHYRLITGYDDTTQQFSTADSLNGPDHQVSYAQFDDDWRVFNRLYIVIYTSEQTDLVASILGEDSSDKFMYERLLAESQADIEANPEDPIAYFNQGEVLTRLGRYEEAVLAFDQARQLGLHWRRLWYQFTPFEAYYAVGRHQDVLELAAATIKGAGGLEEAYYYQGLSLLATNQDGAVTSFQNALAYNENFILAHEALAALNQ